MTYSLIEVVLMIFTLLLGVPVVTFLVECALGLLQFKDPEIYSDENVLSSVILVPAHNEAAVIGSTIANMTEKIGPNDKILLVADNCDDDTADIARQAGVMVVERTNTREMGKGYALAYGVETINSQFSPPPDIVVIVDADCYLDKNAVPLLKAYVSKTDRPVQSCYLLQHGDVQRLSVKIAAFAFVIKNKIRMRGMELLNVPVPLTGSGMAFPWHIINSAKLSSDDIVEDMRLGIEVVERGYGARYLDRAKVFSFFPNNPDAEKTQRERWEHGHLNTIRTFFLPLVKLASKTKRLEFIGVLLNLLVPPLSFLVILVCTSMLLSIATSMLLNISWIYTLIYLLYLISIVTIILIAWIRYGRDILNINELLRLPYFVCKKIIVYISYFVRKQSSWIKTDRD